MITKLSYYISGHISPYRNQAIEEYLLEQVEPDEIILYLWQNQNTVVIGKNQNARAEVRVDALEQDGGHLARRLSGGGAVYHDLGNLNFTFLVRKENYDLTRQCRVILEMARSFGIDAVQTGRNDILADGRKFSGNAYYESGDHCYHHGTIMIDVDKAPLEKYLNVPMEKLKSKGVSSVNSRVVNLSELNVDIDVESTEFAMIEAFKSVYGSGIEARQLMEEDLDNVRISELESKYGSKDWQIGKELPFSFSVSERFSWGGVEIRISVLDGVIDDCQVYSDAISDDFIERVYERLIGAKYTESLLENVLKELA